MERTPKSKKKFSLSNKVNDSNKHENFIPEESTSTNTINTPIQNRLLPQCESDYSPLYIQQTQETLDQLDVVWDWNSPQSKHKQKTAVQKRLHTHQSPRPVKKHLSNNQIESYDKLKTELEALQHQLVESRENEKSSSKALFKDVKDDDADDLKDLENFFDDDDSFEEEMLLQSQKIEQLLSTEIKNSACDMTGVQNIKSDINTHLPSKLESSNSTNYIRNSSSNCEMNQKKNCSKTNISKVYSSECRNPMENKEVNDSLWTCFARDDITETFKNETVSLNDNMEDLCNVSIDEVSTNKICSSEEIEQKRLKALAKLNSKKQHTVLSKNSSSVPQDSKEINSQNIIIRADEMSPIKCSPEEIKQKQMLALAKLHEKKKQEQIEKNRREALRRLELNKKKRALQNLSNKK